jgi:hypothetical protein
MLYAGYDWDLSPTTIVPDKELNTDRLEWNTGDLWQVVDTSDGRKILKKVDPVVKFTLGVSNVPPATES